MKTKLTMIMLIAGFLCADAQPWSWQEDDSLSYAREGLSATTLDDSIFFSGGRQYNFSFVNTVDIYDVGDDTWYTNVLESTTRWWTCAVSCNGKVFFAGGNNLGGSNSFADVDIFDKETGEWTVVYLSVPRNYIGATAHGNKVFFAGGFHMMGPVIYDVIDVYDTETGIWDTLYLSEPKGGISAVAAGSKVFFAGGIIEVNVPTDVVEIYDVNTGEWSYETLSEPRGVMAAAAYGNKVYFAGGLHSLANSSDLVDIYDLDGGWDVPQTLSHPMIVRALNVHDAIVFSGECLYINSNGVYSIPDGTIDIYYPETDQWDLSVPDLSPARVQYACAAYDDKAYYAGGYPGGTSLTDVVSILEYPHCFPDGIIFSTQDEIDNFPSNFPNCNEIEGSLEIEGDDITNLDSLIVLTSIDGELTIENNPLLNSLIGLDSISPGSISNLKITNNTLLATCDVKSVCDYLAGPNPTVEINNNALGCDSQTEVESACWNSVSEIDSYNVFAISPNPVLGSTNLRFSISEQGIMNLDLLEISGRKVQSLMNEMKNPGTYETEINLSDVPPGVYFCVLKTSDGIQAKKIIKL